MSTLSFNSGIVGTSSQMNALAARYTLLDNSRDNNSTTTSTTLVAMNSSTNFSFVKQFDDTSLRIDVGSYPMCSTAATSVDLGIIIQPAGGIASGLTPFSTSISHFTFNTTTVRELSADTIFIGPSAGTAGVMAGYWQATLAWLTGNAADAVTNSIGGISYCVIREVP